MLYAKYLVSGRFESDAILPKIKGSTFRGIFGIALRNISCVLKSQKCNSCILNSNCLYAKFFERANITSQYNTYNYPYSNPFVIEFPLSKETKFPSGSSFNFNLIILGEDNKNLNYFIFALEQMGKIGIGKKINGKRGKYFLEYIKYNDFLVYSYQNEKINIPKNIQDISLKDLFPSNKIQCNKIKINIITPLRVKYHNRLASSLPFHLLIRAILRRAGSLFSWHGKEVPNFDYKNLITEAQKISIIEENIKWFEWRRYSNRQKQSMLIGGIIGSIIYEGNIGGFIPLIDFASKVHIGKQTTFGLGQLEYEILV